MAAPSYTNDLIDWIADTDTAAWGELTGATSGGLPDEADTESALQGTNSVSQAQNTTGLSSMCRILASPVTLSAGQVFLVWHGHGVATALLSYASGGLRLAVATTLGDWKAWSVGGNDVAPFPYAKWVNNPIDPTLTAEYTNGTPPTGATNIYGVGSMSQLSQVVAKGQPHIVDIIRYGRAEARFNGGDLANGYATFSGFAALNDASTARWGLIQSTTGGFLWKGLMVLGYSSVVDFRDSNQSILVQDTRKVLSTFNKIEIRQALSRVDWTGISFTCLSPTTTASKGALEVVDNADVNIDSCTFTDMSTFIFQSGSTILSSIFRRCGLVTQGSAVFTNCTFDKTDDSVKALLSNNLTGITNTTFLSSGTKHAIELNTTTGATYYIDGSDAAATDPQGVWTNDSEAFNGDTTTQATTSTAGSTSSNYLMAEGTNAPGTGSSITSVYARIYGSVASGDTLSADIYTNALAQNLGTVSLTATSASWGSYVALSTPTGGWDWTKAQALEAKIYKTGSAGTANAYRVDIAVLTGGYTSTGNTFTGYASSDGSTGNEAIYNNSSGTILISIASGGTPTIRNGTGANTIVVSSATVTVHVEDSSQNNIQNARVYVTRNADSSLIINGDLTNSSGNVSGSTVAGAGIITIRVRKSSTGTTRYLPVQTTGNVTGTALTVNVILTQDSIASA